MSTIRAGMARFGVAAVLALGVVAAGGHPAVAGPTTAAAPAQEQPAASTQSAAIPLPCPAAKFVAVATYSAPVAGAQAVFDVVADAGAGSVVVEVRYEDSKGRTKYYNMVLPRPVAVSVRLPGDGRGVSNVVKVYARVVASDYAGVGCAVTVHDNGPLPTLDQQCYANIGINDPKLQNNPPIQFPFSAPRAAVQPRVEFETRAAASDYSLQAWMTNSAGERRLVADALFGAWVVHPPQTVLLPRDGRGVYNVVKAEIKLNGVAWYDVLRCTPSVDAGGELSMLESQCFAGNDIKFTVDPGAPMEAVIALQARPSRAGIAVIGQATHSDGSTTGVQKYVDVPDPDPANPNAPGLPWTVYSLTGPAGLTDVVRFTVRVDMVDWPALLACLPSTAPVEGTDPPPNAAD